MLNLLKLLLLPCTIFTLIAASAIPSVTHFRWEDINTRDVVEWRGDTAVVKSGSRMKAFSCKLKIDQKDVDFSVESFGIPESWTTISYTDDQDLQKKQQSLRQKAGAHGIKMMDDGHQFIVDYAWVVENSTKNLNDIARSIRSTARREGYRSTRELLGAFASFAQSLKYQIPPDHRVNNDGERILTAGAFMPLETLSKRWGDCDSKSLLFAALVRSIGLADVCFIVMDDHLFAGVRITAEQDDHYIRHKGRDWVLIELSDSWPIGRIPLDHHNGIVQNKYEVVDIP